MISVAEAMQRPDPIGLTDEEGRLTFPIANLHTHYVSSLTHTDHWEFLYDMGISRSGLNVPNLPEDGREFKRFMMLHPDRPANMSKYFREVYAVLDAITTGPVVAREAFRRILSRAYMSGIDMLEVSTNPAKHNDGGRFDIDAIYKGIEAGVALAKGPYPQIKFGLTFLMAREWTHIVDPTEAKRLRELNETVVRKAIQHSRKNGGIVTAIGIAGPDNQDGKPFPLHEYRDSLLDAQAAGLDFVPHAGETEKANDIIQMLDFGEEIGYIPKRFGHGIHAAYSRTALQRLKEHGAVLEVCPTSNLALGNVKGLHEIENIVRTFIDTETPFTLAPDWDGLVEYGTAGDQYRLLARAGIMSVEELKHVAKVGMDSSSAI